MLKPGAKASSIDPATLDPKLVAGYVARAKEEGFVAHLLGIIPPDSFFGALARGDLLQVLLVSILVGLRHRAARRAVGEKINAAIDAAAQIVLRASSA